MDKLLNGDGKTERPAACGAETGDTKPMMTKPCMTLDYCPYQFNAFVRWMAEHHPEVISVSGVTKIIAREFATSIGRTYSPNTYNKHLNLLSLVFRTLFDTLDIEGNPWANIRRKGRNPKGRDDFTAEQVEVILSKATGELFTTCLIGACSGFRFKDCCLLRYDEIDFDKHLIRHAPFKTRRRRPNFVVRLPMMKRLYDHLASLKATSSGGYVCPDMAAKYQRNLGELSKSMQEFFREKCGFEIHHAETGFEGRALVKLGFHSFRHYFVTRAKEAGIASDIIQEIVGWGSSEMERTYNHISEEKLADAVRKLDQTTVTKPQPASPIQPEGNPVGSISNAELAKTISALQEELERRRKAS